MKPFIYVSKLTYDLHHMMNTQHAACRLLYTNMPQICKADMWLFDTSTHQKSNLLVKLFSPHLSGLFFSKFNNFSLQWYGVCVFESRHL